MAARLWAAPARLGAATMTGPVRLLASQAQRAGDGEIVVWIQPRGPSASELIGRRIGW